MSKRLLFIRHGQTATNTEDRIHVKGSIEKLDVTGKAQSEKLVEVCVQNNIEAIFTSPEERTMQTAQIIATDLSINEIETLEGLGERNWGEWGGKTWQEVQDVLDKMSLEERYKFIPPKGESWEHMENRLRNALSYILEQDYRNIAIVTHGGALRGLMPILKNAPKESSFQYNFHNASLTIFDYVDEVYKEVLENDISHLKK